MTPALKKITVAIATTGLAVALAACSGETQGTATRETVTTEATETDTSPAEVTETETESETETETDAPTSGTEIQASDGSFTTVIPEGWSEGASGSAPSGSLLYIESASTTAPSTLFVITEPAQGTSLEQAYENAKSSAASSTGGTAVDGPTGTIDGEDAMSYSVDVTQGSLTVETIQVLTIHDDTLYAFTLATHPDASADAHDALDEVLNNVSWS